MDIQRLKEVFEKQGSFAIVVGQGYGVDEMSSALSLFLTLKSLNKDVSIVSAKQPLVEVSNLVGIDKVKSNFESSSGDLIVSFPYQQDEIGKVSYTLENGLLNIIVKPKDAPLSFGEKDVIFKRSDTIPEVLIAVGVKRISELQSFFDVQSLKDTTIVNIDKAGANEGYGDIILVNQGSSSVSEQVTSLMLDLSYPLDSDVSQNLMSGIMNSTRNFQSPKTSSLAFEMAGVLLRNGAKREDARPQPQQRTPQQFGHRTRQSQVQDQQPQTRTPQQLNQRSRQVQSQPQVQDQQQPKNQQIREFQREKKGDETPPDWLEPKIYKGSTTVE